MIKKTEKLIFQTPKPWDNEVNGVELLNELESIFNKYIILPDKAATALALWTLSTYLDYGPETKLRFAPRLMIVSPVKRCGKSTLLELLMSLCNKPMPTGNISYAAYFRLMNEEKPTFILDEADSYIKGDSDITNVLNNGFSYNGRIIRCSDGKQNYTPQIFNCFGPVALAAINKKTFEDTTLDRSIIINMRRKKEYEHVEELPLRKAFEDVRRKCVKFIQQIGSQEFKCSVELKGLYNRAKDVWINLLTLASFASDEWYKKALDTAITFARQNTNLEDAEDIGIQLLYNIREIFSQLPLQKTLYYLPKNYAINLQKMKNGNGQIWDIKKKK